jgi:DNA ligase-1
VEYSALVDVYDRLSATDATGEKRAVLAETFAGAGDELPRLVVLVRGRLGPAYDRPELGVSSSLALAAVCRATGAAEADVRERWRETGDLGSAAAWAAEHGGQQTLFAEPLTVARVHDRLREVATFAGAGSRERRVDAVAGLVADADPDEARYVVRTVLGHVRVGVGEGLIRDALADAFLDGSDEAVAAVERAYQLTSDYPVVAERARDDGLAGVRALDLSLGRPVRAMLAEKAETLADGLASAAGDDGSVRCEYKYDGVRVQVHVGDAVRVFTRRLDDVTTQFPDVVRAVEAGVDGPAVLDGELVGYTPETVGTDDREPVPFQELSTRVTRETDVERVAREVPVVCHVFDCLYDGDLLLDRPLADRLTRLDAVCRAVAPRPDAAPAVAGLERATATTAGAADPGPAEALYRAALDAGHEGLMLKDPSAPYSPGRRVGRLLKLKPTMAPLDLVVVRAQYSEGRRSGLLGRLYLACRDDAPGDPALREVGRLSTGYTDEELADLTDRLEDLVVARDGRAVDLRPAVVLEVAYEEVQRSDAYDSGYALRFPRFLGVREDLDPAEADTLARVERLYDEQ